MERPRLLAANEQRQDRLLVEPGHSPVRQLGASKGAKNTVNAESSSPSLRGRRTEPSSPSASCTRRPMPRPHDFLTPERATSCCRRNRKPASSSSCRTTTSGMRLGLTRCSTARTPSPMGRSGSRGRAGVAQAMAAGRRPVLRHGGHAGADPRSALPGRPICCRWAASSPTASSARADFTFANHTALLESRAFRIILWRTLRRSPSSSR